ncbi:MAG: hypothetical protein M1838_001858 [Thelocarpon superellum]|nr:MAG: hypothetical protein M1838_001858 [Thelocarpon superellum]
MGACSKAHTPDLSGSIIFVHGLNPVDHAHHASQTWTHPNGVFWPRDLLPLHLPHARVLLYTYNANVAFNSSAATLSDHAESLLDRYRALSQPRCAVPILFVAHSLGGLIVKKARPDALIRADTHRVTYGQIRESTYGLVFSGTPHRGGHGVGPGKIAARIVRAFTGASNNDILRHLKRDSIFSQEVDDHFRAQLEDYKVVSFFETKPMQYRRYGLTVGTIIVPRSSATLGLASHQESQLELNADHSSMCKFAADGLSFIPVSYHLKRLAAEALLSHPARHKCTTSEHRVISPVPVPVSF